MQRCSCSQRALELFVQDLAGLSIRRQRAQNFYLQTRKVQSRTFRTGRRLQHPEVVSTSRNDAGFIPFDFEVTSPAIRQWTSDHDGHKTESAEDASNADGQWHAEVEILRTAPQHEFVTNDATSDSSSAAVDVETSSALEPDSERLRDQELAAVDAVCMPKLEPHTIAPVREAVPSMIIPQSIPAVKEPLQGSRIGTRMERKARRLAAGNYKPAQNAAQKEQQSMSEAEQEETGLELVLDKIEGMEGEMPKKPKRVQSRENKMARAKAQSERNGGTKATADMRSLPRAKKDPWQTQKAALEAKFGEQGWSPRKRLSPDTLDGIRALHASQPSVYSTELLSEHFKVTPEAIRRILKSKWRPNEDEQEQRLLRWERRGVKKWSEMAEQGIKPPKRWREVGVGSIKGRPGEVPLWKGGKHRERKSEKLDEAMLLEERSDDLAERLL